MNERQAAFGLFLDKSSRLFKRACPSVHMSLSLSNKSPISADRVVYLSISDASCDVHPHRFLESSPILCLQILVSRIVDGIIRVAHLQLGSPRIMNVKHVILDHLLAHAARAFGQVEAPFVESRPDGRTPKTALASQLDLRLHPLIVHDVL